MKRLPIILATLAILVGSTAYAQTGGIDAALGELSELYGSPVVRIDQARAICNQEQYLVECAEIGKKHNLFPEEREREVDALLTQFKGSVIEEFKQCASSECLIGIATRIARELSNANPALARTLDLTPERVTEKRTLVDTAKAIGVDIDECRAMDPDTASVDLLRACAKLAKHETVRQYIPEEYRIQAEKTENTAALKEALANGDIACGNGTLEGCGTYCLNPSAKIQGGTAIPQICRQIAEQFFGDEGIRELNSAYQHVLRTYDEAQIIYTEEYKNRLREGTTTPNTMFCPSVANTTPCPPGQYRQESMNEFGCFVRSACIPFNTKTLPEVEKDKQVICPALYSVNSCPSGEERIVTYSSPSCGTYYSCKPKIEERSTKYPYTFRSGRVTVSFEEARVYCYESGQGGATARGDKGECLQALGISVPDIPIEKQCSQYGTGWHGMDQSGNCFNENMSEYRTSGGILQRCSTAFVYGCASSRDDIPVPSGQKEQIWNSLGLRSWIRSDASNTRIAELKAACANVSSNANIWLSGAGTQSSTDFGMPDPEKCRKAASCTSAQYWDGNACTLTTSTTTWQWTGYETSTSTGSVSGSCSSELTNLLGTGCHTMGNAWFNSGMTSYVMPGGTTVRSCTTEYIYGCTSGSTTTGTAQCGDGKDNDNDGYTDYPADSSCYDKTDNDEWYPSGSTGSSTSIYNSGCASGQYWNGTSCVPSGTTSTGSCPSGYHSHGDSGGYCMNDQENYSGTCYNSSGTATITCPSGTNTSSCPSGQYWNGSSCAASTDTGNTNYGSCGSFTSQSSCTSASNCYWYSNSSPGYCYYQSSPPTTSSCSSDQYWNGSSCVSNSQTSSTSCPSGQYWNGSACVNTSSTDCPSGQYWNGSACAYSQTTPTPTPTPTPSPDYSSQQSSCSAAGGTWDSAGNYCKMPTSSLSKSLAFLCPSGHQWNGIHCTYAGQTGVIQSVANIFEAFLLLLRR